MVGLGCGKVFQRLMEELLWANPVAGRKETLEFGWKP